MANARDCGTVWATVPQAMNKKITDFDLFFGEKSDFGGAGKDIGMEKSEEKNRRKIADFSDKNRFFPIKTDISPKKTDFS